MRNEPKTEAIDERIVRIPLPLPVPGLAEVNCYLIRDDGGSLLVDPGWATTEGYRALTAGLAESGCTIADVRGILVTHAHWDHYSQALALRERHGLPVFLGREERHSIAAFSTLRGSYPNQVRLLRRAGAGELADVIERMPLQPFERDVQVGEPNEWIDDATTFELRQEEIRAHATPGHTRGHLVYTDSGGFMFTGDHLLPRITPSVGFERSPEPRALHSFMQSLSAVLRLPDAAMLPSHGAVGASVHARARELLTHHAERLDEIARAVDKGLDTAATIAATMRWTRHDRRLTELGAVHAMTAVLEVAAHLEVLAWRGDVERVDAGPVDTFRTAVRDASVAS